MQLNKYNDLYEKHKSHGSMLYNFDCKKILDFGISKNVIDKDEMPEFNKQPYPFIDDGSEDTRLLDQ
jgi:hypothetical protein